MQEQIILVVIKKLTIPLCEKLVTLAIESKIDRVHIFTEETEKVSDYFNIHIIKPFLFNMCFTELLKFFPQTSFIVSELPTFESLVLHYFSLELNIPFFYIQNMQLEQIPTIPLVDSEERILMALDETNSADYNTLSPKINMSQPFFSKIIHSLIPKGFIVKESTAENHRFKQIRLTALGIFARHFVLNRHKVQSNPILQLPSNLQAEIESQSNILGLRKIVIPFISTKQELKDFESKLIRLDLLEAKAFTLTYLKALKK